jgi:hypothetical protein
MKYFFVIVGLLVSGVFIEAQNSLSGLFTWDLLWTGSWEESKSLQNRGDFRLGFAFPGRLSFSGKRPQPGFLVRAQALDRRTLNFQLDSPWGDPSKAISGGSLGLYHRASGSRLLYGVLDEWGLPARIRSPWVRSAPYAENHQPIMADLRTTVSSTKAPEAYLYLSSPCLDFFKGTSVPVSVRGFASGQLPASGTVGSNFTPSFSGGLDTVLGKNTELLLEGFYTSAKLPARSYNSWFSDPPPLPDRDFRLGAAALVLNMPYCTISSDWAWSETFAWGRGFYGNAGIRLSPPLPWNKAGNGLWSLSLAADGMSERYIGRDGSSPGGGLRAAGKIERKGPRSSLFRINTMVRGPAMDEPFNRSSSGIYYRLPAPSAGSSGKIPLRLSRVSLAADRNASDPNKIHDGIDAALGLSLRLPPMSLPPALLTQSARKVKNPKPKSYPLGINLSASVDELGSFGTGGSPSPYPFFPANQAFDSAKTSCELLWSPGIFQFRTRWSYTAYAKKDNQWEGSVTSAVRFKYGRFSAKIAWPVFPEKWNCTLSWRLEY